MSRALVTSVVLVALTLPLLAQELPRISGFSGRAVSTRAIASSIALADGTPLFVPKLGR